MKSGSWYTYEVSLHLFLKASSVLKRSRRLPPGCLVTQVHQVKQYAPGCVGKWRQYPELSFKIKLIFVAQGKKTLNNVYAIILCSQIDSK